MKKLFIYARYIMVLKTGQSYFVVQDHDVKYFTVISIGKSDNPRMKLYSPYNIIYHYSKFLGKIEFNSEGVIWGDSPLLDDAFSTNDMSAEARKKQKEFIKHFL